MPGPGLENRIKEICRDVLSKPELIEAELTKRSGQVAETTQTIEKKLIGLDRKEKAALATESNIIKLQAKGDASPEAYKMALAEMKAEKVWIKEERDRLLDQLNMAKQRQGAIITLAEASVMAVRFGGKGHYKGLARCFVSPGRQCEYYH